MRRRRPALVDPAMSKSGELTFKQGGIMLLVIGAGLASVDVFTGKTWEWKGLPVQYIGFAFLALGALLTIVGVVKKA